MRKSFSEWLRVRDNQINEGWKSKIAGGLAGGWAGAKAGALGGAAVDAATGGLTGGLGTTLGGLGGAAYGAWKGGTAADKIAEDPAARANLWNKAKGVAKLAGKATGLIDKFHNPRNILNVPASLEDATPANYPEIGNGMQQLASRLGLAKLMSDPHVEEALRKIYVARVYGDQINHNEIDAGELMTIWKQLQKTDRSGQTLADKLGLSHPLQVATLVPGARSGSTYKPTQRALQYDFQVAQDVKAARAAARPSAPGAPAPGAPGSPPSPGSPMPARGTPPGVPPLTGSGGGPLNRAEKRAIRQYIAQEKKQIDADEASYGATPNRAQKRSIAIRRHHLDQYKQDAIKAGVGFKPKPPPGPTPGSPTPVTP